MEPKQGQDVFSPHAVSPVFSGTLPKVAALTPPPKDGDIEFTEADRMAVAKVVKLAPFVVDDVVDDDDAR